MFMHKRNTYMIKSNLLGSNEYGYGQITYKHNKPIITTQGKQVVTLDKEFHKSDFERGASMEYTMYTTKENTNMKNKNIDNSTN